MAGFFFAALLLLLVGCGEGGCGSEPKSKSGGSTPVTSGASSSGSGGGEVGIPASAAEPRKAGKGTGGKAESSAGKGSSLLTGSLAAVDAATFKPKVLKRPGALVSLYFPGCSDCERAAPALEAVARDFRGKVDVYRMDSSLPENLALLPKGFSSKSYPGFILYRDGAPVSWKQGLPFEPRPAGGDGAPAETDAEYQGRLSQWLRNGLSAGTLSVAP